MLRIFANIAPSTAASRSASSKTMNGALPPNSIDTRSRFCALCSMSVLPTSVDPVKVSFRSLGSAMSGPMTAPVWDVVMTLSTPSGRPASRRMSAAANALNGVRPAGLSTIVHPAAMAGPILRVAMASGKFHGVIIRHGPTGCLSVSRRDAPLGATE